MENTVAEIIMLVVIVAILLLGSYLLIYQRGLGPSEFRLTARICGVLLLIYGIASLLIAGFV